MKKMSLNGMENTSGGTVKDCWNTAIVLWSLGGMFGVQGAVIASACYISSL